MAAPVLPPEPKYTFRKFLLDIHPAGLRDPGARPRPDEFVIPEGFPVFPPAHSGEVARNAVRSFREHLSRSMEVGVCAPEDASGCNPPCPSLVGRIDPSIGERTCRVEVGDAGIVITASDERAFARGVYHLEDLVDLRGGPFLKKGVETRRALFSPRMTHSGYALDQFPDAHLEQMARHGLDAILIFICGVDLTKGNVKTDINDIIRRARGFGLDTYLYSYLRVFVHPDDPDAADRFANSYGRVAAAYPEAKGIVFVGESCLFPSKDPHVWPHDVRFDGVDRPAGELRPSSGWYPCSDYPDWLRAVMAALHKGNPRLETVFWSYNWGWQPLEPRLALINAIPAEATLMATFEMFEPYRKRNGYPACTQDYSLGFAGPGHYFASEAQEAHRLGRRLYSMANSTGHTWDLGSAPYEPAPYLWKKRWDAVLAARRDWGLSGLMENHHYGWTPSFVSELAREAYTEGGIPFERHLRLLAARDFGEGNVEEVLEIWRAWSGAFDDLVAGDNNQYTFLRVGPSYPFNVGGEPIDPATYPTPANAANGNRIVKLDYPVYNRQGKFLESDEVLGLEIELLEGTSARLLEGAARFRNIAAGLGGRRREQALRAASLGEYAGRTALTGLHIKEAVRILHAGGGAGEMHDVAAQEYANAEAARDLVSRDSSLGWEPSIEYLGHLEQYDWKLARMRALYGL